ncbi:MAG: PEP-CTERM sorting domain-containing protein [Phycisphaerae bacterium]
MITKKPMKRLLARVPIITLCLILTILLLPYEVFANGGGKKKVTVKVKFNDGANKWGGTGADGDARRKKYLDDLKAQLKTEWGDFINVKRKNGKEETVPGLDIEVSEGDASGDDISVTVHAMNDAGSGNLGEYKSGTRECHVYPKNMKDAGYSTDQYVALWLEKTSAHEVGHYACASDKNIDANDGSRLPDKMAQSWHLLDWAKNQKPSKTFDEANKDRAFSADLKWKQMNNLNKGGPQCKTKSDYFDTADYGNSTLVIDDPVGEESGIANFAITVSGSRAGDFDLGLANAGDDGLPGTSDDYVLTKWLGNNEMDIDWTPDDGIDNWEHFGPEPLDNVVSLFDTSWYSWAAIEIGTGSEFLLQDFGTLTLLDPEFNDIWGITVYKTAVLDFDFNMDGLTDLSFNLSSDLSSLTQNGELLYALNKHGTGFTVEPLPEPATVLLLGLGGLTLLRLRRVKID